MRVLIMSAEWKPALPDCMRTDLFDFDAAGGPHRAAAGFAARQRQAPGGAARRGGANSRIARCAICRRCCGAGDAVVVNDTKVFAANLHGRRLGRGDA